MRRAIVWSLAAWMILIAGVLALRAAGQAPAIAAPQPNVSSDPELARCREAGQDAGQDRACQAAWSKARDRFFGRSRP